MLILVILSSIFVSSSQTYEDYRLIDANGARLNWYTKLNYALQFKRTGRYLNYDRDETHIWVEGKKLNTSDDKFWFTFENWDGQLACFTDRFRGYPIDCVSRAVNDSIFIGKIIYYFNKD